MPIPHYGLLLTIEALHELAARLKAAGTTFLIEPYLRFPDKPGEQWTMFFRDPAGNALEFTTFRDETQNFATEGRDTHGAPPSDPADQLTAEL